MMYSERDVLCELEIGRTYSEKQIVIYIVENPDVVVISKTKQQLNSDTIKHEVLEKYSGFVHSASQKTYHIPSHCNRIYVID